MKKKHVDDFAQRFADDDGEDEKNIAKYAKARDYGHGQGVVLERVSTEEPSILVVGEIDMMARVDRVHEIGRYHVWNGRGADRYRPWVRVRKSHHIGQKT